MVFSLLNIQYIQFCIQYSTQFTVLLAFNNTKPVLIVCHLKVQRNISLFRKHLGTFSVSTLFFFSPFSCNTTFISISVAEPDDKKLRLYTMLPSVSKQNDNSITYTVSLYVYLIKYIVHRLSLLSLFYCGPNPQ